MFLVAVIANHWVVAETWSLRRSFYRRSLRMRFRA